MLFLYRNSKYLLDKIKQQTILGRFPLFIFIINLTLINTWKGFKNGCMAQILSCCWAEKPSYWKNYVSKIRSGLKKPRNSQDINLQVVWWSPKGNVSVISSDLPVVKRHFQFTTVLFKQLSGQRLGRYP